MKDLADRFLGLPLSGCEVSDHDELEFPELRVRPLVQRDSFNTVDAGRPTQLVRVSRPETNRLNQVKSAVQVAEGNLDVPVEARDLDRYAPWDG
jgi:hypothetical protein